MLHGDNIKDIDWKASARTNSTLVKQYKAEKKHNVLLVLDTGKKMLADTEKAENKKEVALMSAGVVAYIASKNEDYVGTIYNSKNGIQYFPFKQGFANVEKILTCYEKNIDGTEKSDLEKSLDYIIKNINRKMIIFVVTDLSGMESISENTLKKLSIAHNMLFINIGDAYMTGKKVFDLEIEKYIPRTLLSDRKLHELEKKAREETYEKCINKLKKFRIQAETIECNKEIVMKTMDLLERHKHANIS